MSGSSVQLSSWVNGQPADNISLNDRALQYGDGFFTTIAIYNNAVLNWDAHWWRIEQSCHALMLPLPDRTMLEKSMAMASTQFLTSNSVDNAILKMVFTRGEGGKGYQAPETTRTNTLFYFKLDNDIIGVNPDASNSTLKAGVIDHKASINGLHGIKTLNRLENVLGRTEMAQNGYDEAVMLNLLGEVVCGTQSNLFLVNDKTITTPRLDKSGVAGTCRYQLLKLFEAMGFECIEKTLYLQDVEEAQELFFTNALRGVQPVAQFDDKQLDFDSSKTIQQAWNQWQLDNATCLDVLL